MPTNPNIITSNKLLHLSTPPPPNSPASKPNKAISVQAPIPAHPLSSASSPNQQSPLRSSRRQLASPTRKRANRESLPNLMKRLDKIRYYNIRKPGQNRLVPISGKKSYSKKNSTYLSWEREINKEKSPLLSASKMEKLEFSSATLTIQKMLSLSILKTTSKSRKTGLEIMTFVPP